MLVVTGTYWVHDDPIDVLPKLHSRRLHLTP
jgi:hypothetical protein